MHEGKNDLFYSLFGAFDEAISNSRIKHARRRERKEADFHFACGFRPITFVVARRSSSMEKRRGVYCRLTERVRARDVKGADITVALGQVQVESAPQ